MTPRLTLRQRQVLAGLALGSNIKSLALALDLSAKTVEYHWAQVKRVLGIGNVVELARNLFRGIGLIGLIGLIGRIGVAAEAPGSLYLKLAITNEWR
mgnify:CR=1 FL=1